jgi:hypothetical protein
VRAFAANGKEIFAAAYEKHLVFSDLPAEHFAIA